MTTERVTVTLPSELVRDIDRNERNRSKFVQLAVRRELEHRRREELRRSLCNPHTDTEAIAELGIEEWTDQLGEGDEELFDVSLGTTVQWEAGQGWVEVAE